MQKHTIKLSIIIVEYKSGQYLKSLLKKLPKRHDWEVIVVNNDNLNRGYGDGCNEGLKKARGEYVIFLNPDVLIDESALLTLMKYLKHHRDVGIVGPKFINAEGQTELCSTQHPTPLEAIVALTIINRIFPHNPISKKYWIKDWNRETTRIVDVISGAAMMVRRDEFSSLGGFDPKYFLYWEEFDLCKRYRQIGKKSMYIAEAVAYHPREVSMKQSDRSLDSDFVKSREHYMQKFFGFIPMALLETWFSLFEQWRILLLFIWSMLLRLIDLSHITVIGDMGRDYLQAVSILHGKFFPLLGIPSSIPRFQQGPFNVWFSALSFTIGGVHPLSPVIGSAIVTSIGIVILYLFLEKKFGKSSAFAATLLAATAQGAVIQARTPFYLFAVPIFLSIFLWLLTRIHRHKRSTVFFAVISYWMLFQWELATIPFVILLCFVLWRKKVRLASVFPSLFVGSFIGLLPQIIFDITHRCVQLCGLTAWVGYRIAASTGFDGRHPFTFGTFSSVLMKSGDQIDHLFGGEHIGLGIMIFTTLFTIYFLIKRKQHDLAEIALFGIVLLFIGIVLHGDPSEAYFPPLLVLIPIVIAWIFSVLPRFIARYCFVCILAIAVVNSYTLISHHFYARSLLPQLNASRWIVQNAQHTQITVKSYDTPARTGTYLDQYKFFITMDGGIIDGTGNVYIVSQEDGIVLPSVNVLEKSFEYVRVVRSL